MILPHRACARARSRTVLLLALVLSGGAGCVDDPPTEPLAEDAAPAGPVLEAAGRAAVQVAIADARARLIPHAEAGAGDLMPALDVIADALDRVDATALREAVTRARALLDAHGDTDVHLAATRLAVEQAARLIEPGDDTH